MIEYGLSVSLDRTHKTPHAYSQVNDAYGGCGGAPRKMMKFGDFVDGDGENGDSDGDSDESISTRVLFPDDVSRRLDFS